MLREAIDWVELHSNVRVLRVLWVITAENPHETSLVLPGPPGGLKDLSFQLFLFFSLLGTSNLQVGGCDRRAISQDISA